MTFHMWWSHIWKKNAKFMLILKALHQSQFHRGRIVQLGKCLFTPNCMKFCSRKDWVSCVSEEINGGKSISRGIDPWTTKKQAHLVVEGVSSRRDLLLLLISSLTLRWAPTSVYKRSDIKLHTIFFQNYLSKHTKLIIQGVLRSRKKNISNNWKN